MVDILSHCSWILQPPTNRHCPVTHKYSEDITLNALLTTTQPQSFSVIGSKSGRLRCPQYPIYISPVGKNTRYTREQHCSARNVQQEGGLKEDGVISNNVNFDHTRSIKKIMVDLLRPLVRTNMNSMTWDRVLTLHSWCEPARCWWRCRPHQGSSPGDEQDSLVSLSRFKGA